jgi:hypothetical protein
VGDDIDDLIVHATGAENLSGLPAPMGHDQRFIGSQLAWLLEDAVGHSDHSYVMQERCYFDSASFFVVEFSLQRPCGTHQRDTQRMGCGRYISATQTQKQWVSTSQTSFGQLVVCNRIHDCPRAGFICQREFTDMVGGFRVSITLAQTDSFRNNSVT